MLLIPALRRQRQSNLCEFKFSLLYNRSSWRTKSTYKNPVLEKKKKKRKDKRANDLYIYIKNKYKTNKIYKYIKNRYMLRKLCVYLTYFNKYTFIPNQYCS